MRDLFVLITPQPCHCLVFAIVVPLVFLEYWITRACASVQRCITTRARVNTRKHQMLRPNRRTLLSGHFIRLRYEWLVTQHVCPDFVCWPFICICLEAVSKLSANSIALWGVRLGSERSLFGCGHHWYHTPVGCEALRPVSHWSCTIWTTHAVQKGLLTRTHPTFWTGCGIYSAALFGKVMDCSAL